MLQVVADVREERPPRCQLPGHRDRLVQAKMRGVRPPQGIQNQHVQPLQKRHARRVDAVGVGAIGHVAEAESQHVAAAVVQGDGHHARAQHLEGLATEGPKDQPRHAPGGILPRRRVEGIVEDFANALLDDRIAKDRQVAAEILGEDPQVVQAEEVVGVLVRVEHGVDQADLFADQLAVRIRAGCR